MFAELTSYTAYAGDRVWGGHGPWHGGGPGWWLIFPILFWVLVLAAVGYLIYRGSPARSARADADRTLADRYARGEISEDELKQRRAVLRRRS
ncbi:MAG TPA: SHOCT domain-containing protein [Micromonosporaceae bacterium]|jgi:putative membrane protein